MKKGQAAIVEHAHAVLNQVTPQGYEQIDRMASLLGLDDARAVKSSITSCLLRRGVDTAMGLGYNRLLPLNIDIRLGNYHGEATVLGALTLINELRTANDAPILVTHAELAKALPIYYNDFIFGCPSFDAKLMKLLGQCGTVAIIDFNTKTVTITK